MSLKIGPRSKLCACFCSIFDVSQRAKQVVPVLLREARVLELDDDDDDDAYTCFRGCSCTSETVNRLIITVLFVFFLNGSFIRLEVCRVFSFLQRVY